MIPPNYYPLPPSPYPWRALEESGGDFGAWGPYGNPHYGAPHFPTPPSPWPLPQSVYYATPHHYTNRRVGMETEPEPEGIRINWGEVLVGALLGAIFGAVARRYIG